MSPRARRRLYTLGAMLAVFALVPLGFVATSPAGGDLMHGGYFAAIAALLGFIVYAQRRAAVLLKEQEEQSREEAERALELLNATGMTNGVTLRWRARTWLLVIIALLVTGAGAAWGWSERSWLTLVTSGLMLAWAAKVFLWRVGEPEVLRIGAAGIEDNTGLGLIPWQDIKSVFLHESAIRGTKVAGLSIGLQDPGAYWRRLGPITRLRHRDTLFGSSDAIRIQVHTLDMAPPALFRVVRAFHERALPPGALSGRDKFYGVDLRFGEIKQLVAELEKLAAGPPSASGGPTRREEELAARLDALIEAEREQIAKTLAQVRRTNWAAIIAVLLALLVVLAAGMGEFSR